jgi:hypothetical protein
MIALGQYVLVRTHSAGVHMGTLSGHKKKEVVLKNARRLWSWTDARTLSEASLRGVGPDSCISEQVPEIYLAEAVEILPCSDIARANLDETRWTAP